MIMESGPDIVNFDAFAYMDYFFLYPKEISRFVSEGGIIAWGIVPTADFTGQESVEDLHAKLKEGLGRLGDLGFDPEEIRASSLLTPACGMGSMDRAASDRVLVLLSGLSRKMRST
jgi:hypothetical protein